MVSNNVSRRVDFLAPGVGVFAVRFQTQVRLLFVFVPFFFDTAYAQTVTIFCQPSGLPLGSNRERTPRQSSRLTSPSDCLPTRE
jgi:hypothetical protein